VHDREFVDVFELSEAVVALSCYQAVLPAMQVKSELRNRVNLAGSDVGLSIIRRRKQGMQREL
jgi:hypothetical protein